MIILSNSMSNSVTVLPFTLLSLLKLYAVIYILCLSCYYNTTYRGFFLFILCNPQVFAGYYRHFIVMTTFSCCHRYLHDATSFVNRFILRHLTVSCRKTIHLSRFVMYSLKGAINQNANTIVFSNSFIFPHSFISNFISFLSIFLQVV